MRKLEADLITVGLLIGIPVLGVTWFWETFGILGVIAVGGAVAAYVAVAAKQARKAEEHERMAAAAEEQAFAASVAYALHAPDSPDARRDECSRWRNSRQPLRGEAIRKVQILRDGIYHALNSKKPDTAESRMDSARKCAWELDMEYDFVMPAESRQLIKEAMESAEHAYATVRYLNPARGHIEKAATLKTRNAKLKYLSLAEQGLREALHIPNTDKAQVSQLLKVVSDAIAHNN